MTLDRLQQLLDAYGADPMRWPEEERAAALAMLARSAEARAALADAERLDAILDLAESAEPSSDLAARIVAAAPAVKPRRTRVVRRIAILVPLAAAAGLVLWLGGSVETPRVTPSSYAAWDLEQWATPTDDLLAAPASDLYGTPSFGCERGSLGCPELDVVPKSGRTDKGSTHA